MTNPINAVEILKPALDFTNNLVSKFDDEKYAKAVIVIYGHEPNYSELDTLVELIKDAADISTQEKNNLLLAVADKRSAIREREVEYKQECAKSVYKGFEKKCKIALKLAIGVFSGGITLIPDVYRVFKQDFQNKLVIEQRTK